MAKHTTQAPVYIHDMAEGSPPEERELREPVTPFRTTTTPIVVDVDQTASRSADTGLLHSVNVSAVPGALASTACPAAL